MFSLVNARLLRPLPLKDPQQLVSIWRTSPDAPKEPALSRLMSTFLYDVSPLDPFIFGAVIAMLCAIAVAASYVPARRAVAIEPTEALRAE